MFGCFRLQFRSRRSRPFQFPLCTQTPEFGFLCQKSDEYQTIRDLSIESPFAFTKHRESEYGNEFLNLQVPVAKAKEPAEVRVSFEVTRQEHRVAFGLHSITAHFAATSPDLQRFLLPDRRVPLQGVIAELSSRETRGFNDPLSKARAMYDYVIATMRYDKSGTGWSAGSTVQRSRNLFVADDHSQCRRHRDVPLPS